MSDIRLTVLMSLLLFVMTFSGLAPAQELLVEKVLPLSVATDAAQAALSACEKDGYHVSVAVTDRAGLVRVLIRGDQAGAHTLDSSSRKAYTSASLGRSTADLAKMLSANSIAEGLRQMNDKILILAGGLSIKVGESIIGGIGVGGAPGGDKDEVCAQAGIDKIKNHLK